MRTLRRFPGPDRRVISVVSGVRFVTFEISESVSDPRDKDRVARANRCRKC